MKSTENLRVPEGSKVVVSEEPDDQEELEESEKPKESEELDEQKETGKF